MSRDGLPARSLRGADSLREGREYVVLEVYSRAERNTLFRVESEGRGSSALFDIRLFSVIDPKIPSVWKFFSLGGGSFCLRPESWNEHMFWESYYDGEARAAEIYDKERDRIIEEA